jgi:ribonucleoside-diphosphate reductase alpha chain
MSIRCTPYHKYFIDTGYKTKIVDAKDLKLGMKIIRYILPTINSKGEELKYAYTHGLFCAEGTYQIHEEIDKHQCNYQKWNNTDFCKRHQNNVKKYEDDIKCCARSYENKPMLWLYGEKKNLIQNIDWLYYNENESCDRLDVALHHDIKEKYFVPLNYDLKSKIKWLEGYLDGDGSITVNNGVKNIQVSSINKEFLTNVFYLLQTLGIFSTINIVKKEGFEMMPDGKGGKKLYNVNIVYRMNISCANVLKLLKLGYSPKRLNLENITSEGGLNRFIKITAIEDNDEYDDTYCFNEPIEHAGIFNGILTKNCSEIIQYSSPEEIAVCNLASICLPTYIEYDKDNKPFFNFEKLHEIVKISTKNLNKIIDVNFYPVDKARVSNLKHRPIGIGIQGLADTFILMRYPFESDEARKLNKLIAETMYHASAEESMEIAKKRHNFIKEKIDDSKANIDIINTYLNLNEFDPDPTSKFPGAYVSFDGSPASKGKLQFDLWGITPGNERYDWDSLKKDIIMYGMRNSLLIAPMPTASTSQIAGFNECFEPFTSNIYKRKTSSGEFILVNKYLINDLTKLGLWSKEMKNKIIINDGSIQGINEIPKDLQDLYKIVWEIKQKTLIDLATDRGAFVCQSQSMNLFMSDPDFKKLSSMHFYSWQKGLKTGIYYLRTKAKAKPQQFTMEPIKPDDNIAKNEKKRNVVCTEEICHICSS